VKRRRSRERYLAAIAGALWQLCHPVPASATPPDLPHVCTAAPTAPEGVPCRAPLTVHQPCAGVLVPGADLVDCARGRVDLRACEAHREIDRGAHASAVERLESQIAACERARAGHAEEAARCRGEVGGTSGPGWGVVITVGAVALAAGVLAGVLATR
jgi:hypothetical protein